MILLSMILPCLDWGLWKGMEGQWVPELIEALPQNPTCGIVMPGVIGGAQLVNHYAAAQGRVDKVSILQIYRYMGNSPAMYFKKQNIPCLQVIFFDPFLHFRNHAA